MAAGDPHPQPQYHTPSKLWWLPENNTIVIQTKVGIQGQYHKDTPRGAK